MSASREFLLSGIVEGASGIFHAIGRCGDLPIRRGDTFDLVENRGCSESVSLTVKSIKAYEREWEELGPGMTGSLDVEGRGLDLLRPRSILVASESSSTVRAR